MNILITGGTGLIGREFIKQYSDIHQFTVITRDTAHAKRLLGSSISTLNAISEIDDIGHYDAVINLAGEPIADKRWTDTQKAIICKSRWKITSEIVEKINNSQSAPKVLLSGSAIGYYGNQKDKLIHEQSAPNNEFTHELCHKWETIANGATTLNTRVVLLRTGVVLSKVGGALDKMALPFKLGVGGTLGNAAQYISWIHIQDMVNAMSFLLNNQTCHGAFNLTAPRPVTNREFSSILAHTLHRPCLFNVPSFILKLLMGEASTLILEGQQVIPEKLTAAGYRFDYPVLDKALDDIYNT
ncbi:TIGR01777 family oxidoreductase [Alteromonas sp. D210916BOD_24]|uniref:TIGR01777 family oxidoreductase n=1 Tax=Alteromonas sp. D210916BOD_24 TaxID=3157618 RepID=UPI00399CB0B0